MEDADLVVVAVGNGVRVNATALHFKEDFDSQDGFVVFTAKLQHHSIANLLHRMQS